MERIYLSQSFMTSNGVAIQENTANLNNIE